MSIVGGLNANERGKFSGEMLASLDVLFALLRRYLESYKTKSPLSFIFLQSFCSSLVRRIKQICEL